MVVEGTVVALLPLRTVIRGPTGSTFVSGCLRRWLGWGRGWLEFPSGAANLHAALSQSMQCRGRAASRGEAGVEVLQMAVLDWCLLLHVVGARQLPLPCCPCAPSLTPCPWFGPLLLRALPQFINNGVSGAFTCSTIVQQIARTHAFLGRFTSTPALDTTQCRHNAHSQWLPLAPGYRGHDSREQAHPRQFGILSCIIR